MDQSPLFYLCGVEITYRHMRLLIVIVVLLLCTWIGGPLTLFLAWLLQWWASAERWSACDRWASVGGFAWLFGLLAALLFLGMVFPVPLLTALLSVLWERFFSTWNLSLRLVLFRWSLALPTAPTLALLLEWFHPQTIWSSRRVLLETERASLQAATQKKEVDRARAEQAARKKAQAREARKTISLVQQSRPQASPNRSAQIYPPPAVTQAASSVQPMRPEQGTLWTGSGETPALPVPAEESPQCYDWNQGEGSLKDL